MQRSIDAHEPSDEDEITQIQIVIGMMMGDHHMIDHVGHDVRFVQPMHCPRATINEHMDSIKTYQL
jgi:hypothetical protein